ncbi:uncharacterized protein F5147DRAFT_652899 [Suillus discolor]|uniref:Uncharacterized protein n=1 Tax=Suillus discolor TaxID=1912936 RepID=A0A9P7JTY3_9AGAM|nr:uncharacterized protein F5147DRAFT_652899 [Suillus discolor]KAG2108171.1 hypothetical protein F5147DRAFT_652899 [Suillus discolor]
MMWDEFSNIVTNEMHFKMDQHVNTMDLDMYSVDPDLPFLKLNAGIAVINQCFISDAKDCQLCDWILKKVKPDTVNAVLQRAQDHYLKLSDRHQGSEQHISP